MSDDRSFRGDEEKSLNQGVEDAYDTKLDLMGFIESDLFPPWIKLDEPRGSFARSAMEGNYVDQVTGNPTTATRYVQNTWVQEWREGFPAVEPVHVGEEMCELIEYVTEGFEDEKVLEQDVFISAGMAVFSQPMTFRAPRRSRFAHTDKPSGVYDLEKDQRERQRQEDERRMRGEDVNYATIGRDGELEISHDETPYRALAWIPFRRATDAGLPGVLLLCLSHMDDLKPLWEGHIDESDLPRFRWGASYCGAILIGGEGGSEGAVYEDGEVEIVDVAGGDQSNASPEHLQVRKTWQVLMRLCQQQLVIDSIGRAPRGARRRGARAGLEDEGRVRIVALRREKRPPPPDHEPQEVDWKFRWIVKPFWRNQWYPSIGEHRQILVGPYVKGPEDKPLKLPKDRGFGLIR